MALADGLITRETSFFDYGCGHGGDVRHLKKMRVRASGWDPAHRPKERLQAADVVNLGYVLNVIEDPAERVQALQRAFSLATCVLVVAVRVDRTLDSQTEFSDGCITGAGTFQKIFTQAEFREYVETALKHRARVAAMGVAYVFTNEEAESAYLANRAFTRRLEYRTDLIADFARHPIARKYVGLATELGRVPLPDEFAGYPKLVEAFGSPQRVERLTLRTIDRAAFEGSRAQRREDILTYVAMLRLQGLKPPPYTSLPESIRGDVKAIWKTYSGALQEGERFLFSMGSPDNVRDACRSSPVGKLLPEDLYVHRSAEDELPALLRLVVFAARQVVGLLSYDVAKISLDGRAVSFLAYENFDDEPHPRLLRSVKVYLPRASFGIREYQSADNPPILHRKDALVSPTYAYFERFRALTLEEERLGLLSSVDIGFRKSWEALLVARNVRLEGHTARSISTRSSGSDNA